jgi:4-amino-4-deoxy-L-arabinose transferase-like glycosyltransferase
MKLRSALEPRRAAIVAWCAAACFAVIRLAWLGADPLPWVELDFITDEGWYSLNARNHALFGRWVLDEHNVALALCPAHTLALRASYALFGVSFWSTRLVGAAASVATVLLVAVRLRRRPLVAAGAAALIATQPILFGTARVAFCESLQLFFLAAAWFLVTRPEPRRRDWIAAGAAASLAVLSKATAAWAVAFVLAAPFLHPLETSRPRRVLDGACAACGLALGVLAVLPFGRDWLPLALLESSRESSVLWRGEGLPKGPALAFLVGMTTGPFQSKLGFWLGVLPLAAVAGATAARRVLTIPGEQSRGDVESRMALAWLVLSYAFLSLRHTAPLGYRYWGNLLPPLAVLACTSLEHRVPAPASRLRTWAALCALVVGPALAAREALLPALLRASPTEHLERAGFVAALLPAAVLALLAHRLDLVRRVRDAPRLLAVCAAGCIILGAATIAIPVARRTYTIRDTARALSSAPGVAVLAGDVANTMALETPYRAFVWRDLARLGLGTGWVNGDWRARGATHCVAASPASTPFHDVWCPPGATLVSSAGMSPSTSGDLRLRFDLASLETARGPTFPAERRQRARSP